MADLDRYSKHPASTVTGATAWFDDQRPLGAGRHQVVLCNNALHLVRQNSLRTLAHHVGSTTIWRTVAVGTASGAPTPDQVQWMRLPADGVLLVDLGVQSVVAYGTGVPYPRLKLSARWAPESAGDTVGAVLVVLPAALGPAATAPVDLGLVGPAYYDSDSYTGSTAFANLALQIPLTDEHVAELPTACAPGYPPSAPTETGVRFAFRSYLGTYNSSNQNAAGRRASMLGISLYLETPP